MPNNSDWTEEDSLDDDPFLPPDEQGPPDNPCGCEDPHDMYDD